VGQLVTGALSDRWGRKRLIASRMLLQAARPAFVAVGTGFAAWTAAPVVLDWTPRCFTRR